MNSILDIMNSILDITNSINDIMNSIHDIIITISDICKYRLGMDGSHTAAPIKLRSFIQSQ